MDLNIFDHIKKLIRKNYYDVKLHTRERMIERNIKIREVKEAIDNGLIIEEYGLTLQRGNNYAKIKEMP